MNAINQHTENNTNQELENQAPQKAVLKNNNETSNAWVEVQELRDKVDIGKNCIIADDYSIEGDKKIFRSSYSSSYH